MELASVALLLLCLKWGSDVSGKNEFSGSKYVCL